MARVQITSLPRAEITRQPRALKEKIKVCECACLFLWPASVSHTHTHFTPKHFTPLTQPGCAHESEQLIFHISKKQMWWAVNGAGFSLFTACGENFFTHIHVSSILCGHRSCSDKSYALKNIFFYCSKCFSTGDSASWMKCLDEEHIQVLFMCVPVNVL